MDTKEFELIFGFRLIDDGSDFYKKTIKQFQSLPTFSAILIKLLSRKNKTFLDYYQKISSSKNTLSFIKFAFEEIVDKS